ncbi:MAG: Acyl carrier protein [Candidatus Hydrogenedentes bacterium ADurb.Bin101]|jgi:acyl carrier protein|nr:MAG: Acyl carrier protein [Candidatus Hydrogenedentes bacterium ADurb.Bin101]HOC67624.1 acyl carrier protein [Candidatus Hydrogenedentota bacterium]
MSDDITNKIRQLIADRFERKIEEVTDDARFTEDLGADSLDTTELLMNLEEEFGIEIDDEANTITNVGEAIAYIKARL